MLTASERRPYFPIEPADDDDGWAVSNELWFARTDRTLRRSRHERASAPLFLCGHGVSLRVDKGTLLIRNGFTHYPQQREEYRFFKGDLALPRRIVMLDGSGAMTFDVLAWLSQQGVSLVRVDYKGEVTTVMAGAGSVFDRDRVDWQDATRAIPERRLAFCKDIVIAKVEATLATLQMCIPPTAARGVAFSEAEKAIAYLRSGLPSSINEVLLAEARAAAAYFAAWRGLPLRWKARAKFPVPDHWREAGTRRTVRDSRWATNRNATHPVNAMLNYGYALLHSQVQTEAVALGFDPRRGILHESRPDASALILDLMEPRRPRVDAAILKFVNDSPFSGADFALSQAGVCRLAPQLAKRVCAVVAEVLAA